MANETKKAFWVFNKDKSVMSVNKDRTDDREAERARPFSFKLERYKDRGTHEEHMQITNYIGKDENGTIYTSIDRLDKDIFLFKRYGVVIGDTYLRDLEREIQKSYLDIALYTEDLNIDKRFDGLIELVKEYISNDEKLMEKDQCFIPVGEFDKLAADCGFKGFEMQALRKQLKEDEIIFCSKDRYTKLKRIEGRTERVIAFSKERIGLHDGENAQEDSTDGT